MKNQTEKTLETFRSQVDKKISSLSPYQILFITAISVFLANGSMEFILHRIFNRQLLPQEEGIIESFLIFLMIFPPLYLFAYRPMVRRIDELNSIKTKLLESELRYRMFFDHLPIGALVMDPETRQAIDFNGAMCWQLGYSRDEFGKLTIDDYDIFEKPEETRKRIEEILREGSATFETRHKTKSGEIRDVEVTVRGIWLNGRRVFLSVFHDITAHKRMIESMSHCAEVERMASLGRLSGGVAHEINNALSGVLGMAELLKLGKVQGDEVDIILHEGRRAAKVAQDLLMFSRPQAPNMQLLELPAVIRQVERIVSKDLRLRKIAVDLHAPENLPPVRADESQMHQVFINLILNARDAMPGGGRIDITLRAKGRFVQMEVADTGSGIPEENLARVFDPFFTTKEKGKGTGLGLSVVYGIFQAHGGMIVASNRSDRSGAVLSMILPIAKIEATPSPRISGEGRPEIPQGMTILVVEDESYIRQYCARIIESSGHRAVLASTVDEAIQVLRDTACDIVLCDQFLVGRHGLDLLADLRSRGRPEAARFILMTGASPEEIGDDVEIIFKPFGAQQLSNAISRVAGSPAPARARVP